MNINRYFLVLTIAIISWPTVYGQTWNTTGNSGTTMSDFLGTTDSKSLRFRTNNTQVAILDSTGKFGIGIAIPAYNLDVNGNARISSTLQIGSSTSYPSSTIFNAFGGVSMMHFSQGQSSVSPTLSIYNTSSSAKALSVLVGTSGTALIFDSTGWYGIGSEPKSNITGGMPTAGKLYYKMFADGQSIFSTSSVTSTTAQSANVSILNTQSSSIAQLIRGASIQNVDLSQWRDFSGNILARVDKAGKATFKGAIYSGYTNSSLLTDSSFVPRKYVDSLSLVNSQSGWKLTGNTGINASTNFIGNTDSVNLNIRTNNLQRLKIYGNGQMVAGAGSPYSLTPSTLTVTETPSTNAAIVIDASNTNYNPILQLYSTSSNSYYPAVVFKTSNWGQSQIDQYEGLSYTVPSSLKHTWYVGATRKMVLSESGNLLLATTTDDGTNKLQVNGGIKINGLAIPTNAGAGRILTSDANGVASWQDPTTLSAISNNWSLTGNSGIDGSVNFIGTTDGRPILFKTNNTEVLRIDPSGRIGIGTPSPEGNLHLFGTNPTIILEGDANSYYPSLQIKSNVGVGVIDTYGLGDYYHGIMFTTSGNVQLGVTPNGAVAHTLNPNAIPLKVVAAQAQQSNIFQIAKDISTTFGVISESPVFLVNKDGGASFNSNVRIGTNDFSDTTYKLFVEGFIRARKIRVDNQNMPDYVFENNYRLPSLAEVQMYINEHKHLQDIPSAEDVKKNGLDVGENQAVLLKKIEELTLYAIEQNKQIETQNKILEQQQRQIDQLMKLVDKK